MLEHGPLFLSQPFDLGLLCPQRDASGVVDVHPAINNPIQPLDLGAQLFALAL